MAIIGAVATLFAALFICLAPHGGAEGRDRAHAVEAAGYTPAERVVTAYACPYDDADCRLFPHLNPAVLTAPPLDPPPHTDVLVRAALPPATGPPAASQERSRAPDLHALQILRT
ncbi:hypothetical protein ACFT5C_09345 [Streptomyces sp. NPDC057116]|uniref:hypothetical protein n=1 Tax=Streptomyces sp. NPDC057116 TaxID=3346023 RepID=UPI003640CCA7